MKRIRVPEEMIRCAVDATCDSRGNHYESVVRLALEAALLWLSEHPQVPTDKQALAINSEIEEFERIRHREISMQHRLRKFVQEWQSRCFQEEEPEIPAEIEDLLAPDDGSIRVHTDFSTNQRVLEAYRRGLRKGEQK